MEFKKPDSYKNINTSSTNSQPNKPPLNIKPKAESYRLLPI